MPVYIYANEDAIVPFCFLEYASEDAAPERAKIYYVYTAPNGQPLRVEDSWRYTVWQVGKQEPFGNISLAKKPELKLPLDLRFAGHFYDPYLKLHYNRFRDYDPATGRYLQPDPIGHDGGVNLYGYPVNPLVDVDLRGLMHRKPKRSPAPEGDSPAAKKGDAEQGKITPDRIIRIDRNPIEHILADFDADAIAMVKKSPTLVDQLQGLDAQKWSIKKGAKGDGSWCDRDGKSIVIDGDLTGRNATSTLAHEAGHATYQRPPDFIPDNMSREDYLKSSVDQDMLDEGHAQYNALQARDEIYGNGGPDIGIPGAQGADYHNAYYDHKHGKISKEQAVERMADTMANEVTSTDGQNYRDYYGERYQQTWDAINGVA